MRNPAILQYPPKCLHVMSGIIQVTSESKKPCHIRSAKSQPAQVMSATPGPAHVMPAKPKPAHIRSAKLQPANIMSATPEPANVISAMEAVHELIACPVTPKVAVYELTCCPVMAMEADDKLTFCSATVKWSIHVSAPPWLPMIQVLFPCIRLSFRPSPSSSFALSPSWTFWVLFGLGVMFGHLEPPLEGREIGNAWPWPGLPGAKPSGEMRKSPIWAMYGLLSPDPGKLEESEKSTGNIVLSPRSHQEIKKENLVPILDGHLTIERLMEWTVSQQVSLVCLQNCHGVQDTTSLTCFLKCLPHKCRCCSQWLIGECRVTPVPLHPRWSNKPMTRAQSSKRNKVYFISEITPHEDQEKKGRDRR
ncbi:Foot protein 1 variant 1 [Labeo rohita]|uniref:Foot protein 1 variant 1 n=1 Tax=Labeo rohita TaxID=84645 RepID=A0ABQ8LLL4_LABRO|nr:Foot protein 1 variant 1 [Labeo rohita]